MLLDIVIDRIARQYPNDPQAQQAALKQALRDIDLTKE